MFRAIVIASRTYLAGIWAARSSRVLFWAALAALLAVVAGRALGLIGTASLTVIRRGVLLPGLPLLAVVAAEVPLRDGIDNRTLLYPLLGPVPRATLAVVRTVVGALIVFVLAGALLVVFGLAGDASLAGLAREITAALVGALAYAGMFGLLHLLTRRGLVAGLAIFLLGDLPIGGVPFAIRGIAPSAHLRAVAGLSAKSSIPVPFHATPESPLIAAAVLLVLAGGSIALTAWAFARRDLGEIC